MTPAQQAEARQLLFLAVAGCGRDDEVWLDAEWVRAAKWLLAQVDGADAPPKPDERQERLFAAPLKGEET